MNELNAKSMQSFIEASSVLVAKYHKDMNKLSKEQIKFVEAVDNFNGDLKDKAHKLFNGMSYKELTSNEEVEASAILLQTVLETSSDMMQSWDTMPSKLEEMMLVMTMMTLTNAFKEPEDDSPSCDGCPHSKGCEHVGHPVEGLGIKGSKHEDTESERLAKALGIDLNSGHIHHDVAEDPTTAMRQVIKLLKMLTDHEA